MCRVGAQFGKAKGQVGLLLLAKADRLGLS